MNRFVCVFKEFCADYYFHREIYLFEIHDKTIGRPVWVYDMFWYDSLLFLPTAFSMLTIFTKKNNKNYTESLQVPLNQFQCKINRF